MMHPVIAVANVEGIRLFIITTKMKKNILADGQL